MNHFAKEKCRLHGIAIFSMAEAKPNFDLFVGNDISDTCIFPSAISFYYFFDCVAVKRHLNSLGHIMVLTDGPVFWLFHTSTDTNFFPKPLTNFFTCIRGEMHKFTGKRVRRN